MCVHLNADIKGAREDRWASGPPKLQNVSSRLPFIIYTELSRTSYGFELWMPLSSNLKSHDVFYLAIATQIGIMLACLACLPEIPHNELNLVEKYIVFPVFKKNNIFLF